MRLGSTVWHLESHKNRLKSCAGSLPLLGSDEHSETLRRALSGCCPPLVRDAPRRDTKSALVCRLHHSVFDTLSRLRLGSTTNGSWTQSSYTKGRRFFALMVLMTTVALVVGYNQCTKSPRVVVAQRCSCGVFLSPCQRTARRSQGKSSLVCAKKVDSRLLSFVQVGALPHCCSEVISGGAEAQRFRISQRSSAPAQFKFSSRAVVHTY